MAMPPQAYSGISLNSIIAFITVQLVIAALVVLDLINPFTSEVFGATCFAVLGAITYLTWRQTEQGNHPIFLFMVFLILFQFGRIPAWLISGDWTLSWFDLGVAHPFTVGEVDLKKSMLMIPLSASFVYLGFFYKAGRKVLTFTQDHSMRGFFGWLYFLTIPFVVFKDVSYLKYTLEHGGYIATYLSGGEHVEQVGNAIRAMALLNTMAFVPYLILESRKRPLLIAVVTYLAVMVLELLVGLRGKFFITFMFLWMVYNIKTGSSFKPITATVGALLLIVAAIGAEIFRESKSGLDVNLVGYFFYTQGISFFVTVSSVIYYDLFQGRAVEYLLNEFLLPFQHVSTFGEGALLTLDLTWFLNPQAAKSGFGTGGAYLADLYLLGGYLPVCVGSFLLGDFCSRITYARSVFWRTIALSILLWVPYLPRSGYLDPLAISVKYFIMAVVGFALYGIFGSLRLALGVRALRERQAQ